MMNEGDLGFLNHQVTWGDLVPESGDDRSNLGGEIEPGQELIEKLKTSPIMLVEARNSYTQDEITAMFPGQTVVVCDFAVTGIENGAEIEGGYVNAAIINIDHHAPAERMERAVSSTNLAIEYVQTHGPVPPEYVVIINHTDADSILSSAIIRGILPPDSIFGEAAIAADHTGEENEIADLLGALQKAKDVEKSLRNLDFFLRARPLDPEVRELIKGERVKRERAAELVESGRFTMVGDLAYAVLDAAEKVDSALLPPVLPEAKLILTFSPLSGSDHLEVKIRLGNCAPSGISLHRLGIAEIDPIFGGRWNAGSNKRGGGTAMAPAEYANRLSAKLSEFLLNREG